MKVLILASYIYDDAVEEFTKNKTGFGLMVKEIANNVSAFDEVYLLTRVITQGKHDKDYEVLRHKWKDVFGSLSIKYLFKGIKEALSFKQNVKGRLRHVYYYLDGGYVKKTIKQINPDIVHIHGVGHNTKAYIMVCKELSIPYMVTLHGLIGLNDSVLLEQHEKNIEKFFLIESERNNVTVTVISSGIKKRIINNYGLLNGDNIRIITNGTNTQIINSTRANIREKYNIPDANKIIICVGNISQRKNQLEVIKAFSKIENEYKEKISILFLGNDCMDGAFQESISELGYEKNLIPCGFVDKRDIPSYLTQAELNIVASIDEGFGLSIIESFVYGVPTVTFSDLDAIEDLYHENAIMLVNDRSDKALAQGIEKALRTNWDKEWIKEYSKQFSLEKMTEEYHKCYLEVVKKR
jgi:glycosyltransferase involved in cell wall biosynthesis